VSMLLKKEIINRSGVFIEGSSERISDVKGVRRYTFPTEGRNGESVYITEPDIENVITAKAAIFAAIKILIQRLDLSFQDVQRFYIAGAFGNYINIENAISIGLVPNIPREKIRFVGNTAIRGAKIAAFYREGFKKIAEIRRTTTYYDLMGADDYVEEFQKAMFLPHTDIELFQAR
jgi:uncharacterized 2Fe-2S/4Fe-4S cluster protein (DUF4445 family)